MNKEHHKNEIAQIKKHMKMLNITGGIAVCSLVLGGVLMIADIFDAPAENLEGSNSEYAIDSDSMIASREEATSPRAEDELLSQNNENQAAITKNRVTKRATASKPGSFSEELQSFEASCNDGAMLFQWVTSGGTKYAYEIEKTYDQVTYEVFSRAPQPEKKDGKNLYAVEETAPTGDEAFYRLRKVIGKGKYEYSEAVKVKCTDKDAQSATVDVFPNGNGSFRIIINTAVAGAYKVTLSDINETELATEEFLAREGNNEFILSSSSITRGNYTLRVSNDSMVKEKKVVLK